MCTHTGNFWLFRWHITYANVSGFYMGFMFLLTQLTNICLVSDLSQEYDLKREYTRMCNNNNNEPPHEEQENPEEAAAEQSLLAEQAEQEEVKESELCCLVREMFTHVDTVLLLGVQFMETSVVLSMNMTCPIIVTTYLHWSHTAYDVIKFGTSVFSLLPCLYLVFRTIGDHTMYCIALPSVLAYALLQLVQMVWVMDLGSEKLNIFLAVVYSVMFTVLVLIRDVFVGSFLAKMVSSRHQSSADSIRIAVSRVGAIFAMLSAPYALEQIEVVGWVLISFIVLFALLLFARRKTLKNPTVIIN